MKSLGDMLLRKEAFSEIVMGNTALVRAMIEAGTRAVTSYPGSPTPEIAAAIKSIPPDKRPFYFEFSTNEKVATEVAYGAALNGHFSTVFFKSVGLNVAADVFVQLNHMNIIGGMVIVLGDDPGANSSQNEQDNRHYAYLSYTPVYEPSTPAEVYRFYLEAASLSRRNRMPVILRLTTHVCHAKEKVTFKPWKPKKTDDTPLFDSANGPYIPLTAEVFNMKRRALNRLETVRDHIEDSPVTEVIDNKNRELGIITSGFPFLSVMDVLELAGKKPDVLKLGVVYPLPLKAVGDFIRSHSQVKIIEELDDCLERSIKTYAFEQSITSEIMGKTGIEDWIGEYTPDRIFDILKKTWPDLLPDKPIAADVQVNVPARPAQLCPGCGHRSAFYAIKKALKGTEITVADIGCHTLGFLPPYQVGEILMCMGASTAIGSGLSLFNESRNVLAFLGDSTFFHAGLPGILNILFNQHRITLMIMENGTTAMTGHQDHPASGMNFNEPTEKIPIRRILEGFGVQHIFEIDTYNQSELTKIVKTALNLEEFSVVIAKHPCMLKFIREQQRKPGFIRGRVDIDQTRCDHLHLCVEQFGCPSFQQKEGGRIQVNPDLCIGDGSCIQTCPVKAISPGKGQ
jgi:indolepyruvate ferredoxin oxidoreductase alpha subunit